MLTKKMNLIGRRQGNCTSLPLLNCFGPSLPSDNILIDEENSDISLETYKSVDKVNRIT